MRRGTVFALVFGAVVLLGTAGAVSRFVGRKERPKAYECKVVLRDILWAQRAYRDQHGAYAKDLAELRVKVPEKAVYTYSLRDAGTDDFLAVCEWNGDVWTVSPASGEPRHAPAR